MKITHRFLATFIIAIIATFCLSATAYASQPATAESLTGIGGEEAADVTTGEAEDGSTDVASDETITGTAADTTVETTADATDETPEDAVAEDAEEQTDDEEADTDIPVTGDGSDASEENPTDDIVIEDIPETTDTPDVESEVSDSKTDNGKTKPVKEKPTYTEAELRLLACLIYTEAGNQSYQGMLAVANVVLNRVKSNVYWHVNTIEEVIYDRKWAIQFSVTKKNSKTGLSAMDKALKCYDTGKFTGGNPEAERKAMNKAIKAAKDALNGKNNIGNYLNFCGKSSAKSIKKKYPDYKIIGDHIFYRTK